MSVPNSGAYPSVNPPAIRDLAEDLGTTRIVRGAFRRDDVDPVGPPSAIVGRSAAVRRVLEQIAQVAQTDATVLLLGATGTGKELFASHLHELSARRSRDMVRVNCAAIPSTLMESELFGCERGAFTDAVARRIGRFELANHSTIFLDEIGDLPSDVQVKLLRVLEERRIERLGNPTSIEVDVRIVAATHRDLEQRIGDGTFREDLFYRLNVFPIRVPPLRERAEDIPLLVWRFVDQYLEAARQADRHDPGREPGEAAGVRLAGQHPRTAKCRGAGNDRGHRIAADHSSPFGHASGAAVQRQAD